MSAGMKKVWGALAAVAAIGTLLVLTPSRGLEPAFSQDDSTATRDIKVCILLLAATGWENPEPFFLPTLASEDFQNVRNLRPSNWNLVNPLAPTVVTPAIANLWDRTFEGDVIFDGLKGYVDNDFYNNGNVGQNQAAYLSGADVNGDGQPDNPGGPNTYRAHCQPIHLAQFGTNGTGGAAALPAEGQPIPRTHPAYWEVPLTPVTVSQLANFDAVFVNTHRNLRFSQQEQVLLKQFLDQGGTLYLEDSHGCRIEVRSGGDKTNPADVDFFLPFQFCDGFPGYRQADGTRQFGPADPPDGYPMNIGGVSAVTPVSKTVVNPNHPLFNLVNTISPAEAERLGDVLARDHLMIRTTSSAYLVEELLRTTATETLWSQPDNPNPPPAKLPPEPALAVARIGNGKLILSGIDMIDDCSKPYETGQEPDANVIPDIKFMYNLLAWRGGVGGNRRGGANNPGVGASNPVQSLLPRELWSWPDGGPGNAGDNPPYQNVGADSIAAVNRDLARLGADLDYTLKEPLVAAHGVVYAQYEDNGTYYLVAIDADPSADLDGDGNSDDGPVRDVTLHASNTDTLWIRSLGGLPVLGASVVAVQHEAKNVPVDVLLFTQADPANGQVFLWALNATIDGAVNSQSPVETPGTPFYNWSTSSANWTHGTDGYIVLDGLPNLAAQQCSAPVVYDDHIYVAASFSPDAAVPGEWIQVSAVRLVRDPSTGAGAGDVSWRYPDLANFGGMEVPASSAGSTAPAIKTAYQRVNALKQVDAAQAPDYGLNTANYLGDIAGAERQFPTTSRIVPRAGDSTHLLPVVSLVRDSRTGLTVPTVFINRANGDVWAVSATDRALGWRINGEISTAPNPPIVSINGEPALTLGTDFSLDYVTDSNGDIVATDLFISPAQYRGHDFYAPVSLDYWVGGRHVREQRQLYPRHRLLRVDRHSGYEATNGVIDLLGWSTGAPMVLGTDTVVATSTSLWRQAVQPQANYSGQPAGNPVGSAYQIRASGPVAFLDAAGDALGANTYNGEGNCPVRWQFDPGIVLRDSLAALNTLQPQPQQRGTFSVHGAPVRYGDSVVVAGCVHNAASVGASINSGGVIAIDANPILAATIDPAQVDLDEAYPTYLLSANPAALTPADNVLSSLDPTLPADAVPLRAWVIDPAQYTLDYSTNELHLRADQAHLTRLAQPMPDNKSTGEPFPEALRLPLYGRYLWVVQDRNRDGLYDGGDAVAAVYVPAPVKWMVLRGTLLLRATKPVTGITQVRNVRNDVDVTSDFALDPDRPIVTFDPAALGVPSDPNQTPVEVNITYTTSGGGQVTERHRLVGWLPGFSFSPVVAGDTIFLAGTQMPTLDPNTSVTAGGLYALAYGRRQDAVDIRRLVPTTVPGWSNFSAGITEAYVRGIPLALDGAVFVSFGLQGDGTGGADGNRFIAPLYAIGGSHLLVTESMRLARVDYEGRVLWQLTGTKEKNPAERPVEAISNNPRPTDLITTPLARPAKGLNLSGSEVMIVDTGNNRVVRVDNTGLVLWPRDTRINSPDGALRYVGLRDFGLKRPSDVGVFRYPNSPVHRWAQWDVNGDGAIDDNDRVAKDGVVIADRGNQRIVVVVSHDRPEPTTGVTQTYYQPIRHEVEWPLPANPNDRMSHGWTITAETVYDPASRRQVEIPYVGVFPWDPQAGDGDAYYDPGFLPSGEPKDNQDLYFVAWAEGWDRIFNLRMDGPVDLDGDGVPEASTINNGYYDDNNDGIIDGIRRNLNEMIDEWSRLAGPDGQFQTADDGWAVFRGLQYVKRYRRAGVNYLVTIQTDDNTAAGAAKVMVYRFTGSDAASTPVTDPADGILGSGLHYVWQFTRQDYAEQVYGSPPGSDTSYYERAGILWAERWDRWYSGGAKQWKPIVARMMPAEKLMIIVNGASNSVNQTASNSEILLVRFDPSDATVKRVEHVLPDLSTTTNYPAGQAASRREPEGGSYPLSSPVECVP